ncbi:MAG: aspartate/glutamate racemase family protein [Lautropia sp.]
MSTLPAGAPSGVQAPARPGLRIGLMVPANNTTMHDELLAWMPPGSTVSLRRIPRGKGLLTPETIGAYTGSALELAGEFRDETLDAVAYGCTAAGFISGPAGDAALRHDLERITGKPVVSTANAMVDALVSDRARRIALVTPYQDDVNERLRAYLSASSIEVSRFASFYARDTDALGRIGAAQVAALARETMADDCDALFIGCSQLPTHAIIDALRLESDRPAWSSIRATAWAIHRLLNARR